MKKIILFNTSFGTKNMGDYIINKSVKKELTPLLDKNFIIEYPTHTPTITLIQNSKHSTTMRACNAADIKMICGTNIIKTNLLHPWPDWNINIFNYRPYKNSILVGVGSTGGKRINFYTRHLYKKILSKNHIHSTRDERTKKLLEKMGFQAINTGCATLWQLTSEKCKKIKQQKSDNVIFTLTDYCKDPDNDQKLINILKNNYKKIYFWVQGFNDYEYLKELSNTEGIILIYGLDAYEKILNNGDIDYIGTRLHAGIFAMQHNIRSIILSIDNRVRDIQETYNLPIIERKNIKELDIKINSTFATNINIDTEAIEKWKKQFIKDK